MPAAAAADRISAVINRCVLGRGTAAAAPPPGWFFTGGSAATYWLMGVVQKLVGWPVNGLLARKFGMVQLGV